MASGQTAIPVCPANQVLRSDNTPIFKYDRPAATKGERFEQEVAACANLGGQRITKEQELCIVYHTKHYEVFQITCTLQKIFGVDKTYIAVDMGL